MECLFQRSAKNKASASDLGSDVYLKDEILRFALDVFKDLWSQRLNKILNVSNHFQKRIIAKQSSSEDTLTE